MRGSVRLKGKTWSYRIDLGEINGKRKQIERSGYKTEKEALVAFDNKMQKEGCRQLNIFSECDSLLLL